MDELIKHYYYQVSEPSALGGKRPLVERLGNKHKKFAKQWLMGQRAYTLHRPAVTKFKRRPTIVSGPGVQVQADLMDVRSHSDDNDGVTFLLNIVDVFSKRAWSIPLRSKSAQAVVAALEANFLDSGYKYFQTDKGKEFLNTPVKRFFKEQNIKQFSSENETIKASIVERFNQTLRKKIHRLLTYRDGKRFIDALPKLIEAYNKSKHSSTGFAPVDVGRHNVDDVWFRLYESKGQFSKKRKPKLKAGQHVRISTARATFERGYTPNWSEEVFVIVRVLSGEQPVVYEVRDLGGETIDGRFYEEELQPVAKPTDFRVEKILKRRGRGANQEIYIKWLGYPQSFNSWVRQSDFV